MHISKTSVLEKNSQCLWPSSNVRVCQRPSLPSWPQFEDQRWFPGVSHQFLIRVGFPAFLCCVTFPCERSNLVGDQLVVSHLLHIRHTILVQIFLVILFVGLNVLLCPLHQRLPTVMQYGITLSHPSHYLEEIKSTELYAALTRSAWHVTCCENLWEVTNTAVMLWAMQRWTKEEGRICFYKHLTVCEQIQELADLP